MWLVLGKKHLIRDGKLRQELNDIAISKCRGITEKFAQCAKESGYMVIFKCRQHNKDMNACLHQYTNPEQFKIYCDKREKDVLAEATA
ncbi:hypothetical protein BBJ28_00023547 [Nothophytophthora sp. Chile5]|nr:hypothetical protein BBJ28_00023547 [Nothophytophthora sp. Chile5]